MKDIKSLYESVKSNRTQDRIDTYTECVEDLLMNKPNDYMLHLEYIILSSIGLNTWNQFVEQYGFPITQYDYILETFQKCLKKCKQKGEDSSLYEESLKNLELMKKQYFKCFLMYEDYEEKLTEKEKYNNYFYTKNYSLLENFDKLFSRYGLGIIPDIIIECKKQNKVQEFVNVCLEKQLDPMSYQWILECLLESEQLEGPFNMMTKARDQAVQARTTYGKNSEEFKKAEKTVKDCERIYSQALKDHKKSFKKDTTPVGEEPVQEIQEQPESPTMYERTLEYICDEALSRNEKIYQESLLNEEFDVQYEYSDFEIKCMEDMISFNEYMITYLEDNDEMLNINNYTLTLYETLGNIIDDGESSAVMAQNFLAPASLEGPTLTKQETVLTKNTSNKYSGDIPQYLKKNHSLGYGEDDKDSKSDDGSKEDKKEDDIDLDDLKRVPDTETLQDLKDDLKTADTPEETQQAQQAINNYYYNYINSHNVTTTDDHSVGKRIHSDDINSRNQNHQPIKTEGPLGMFSNAENEINENAPWSLNVNFNEGVSDAPIISSENVSIENYFKYDYNFETVFSEADDPPSLETHLDMQKPTDTNPVRHAMQDLDRKMLRGQQRAKKGVQNVQNFGRAVAKPGKRTSAWLTNMINQWKDKRETDIKEKMADRHQRTTLLKGVRTAVITGSLFKAGLLLNPIFLFLAIANRADKKSKTFRLRNEMIGELKTELEVIDVKIQDAASKGDNKAKYQLMRLRNEIRKKLLRVGGGKDFRKII